MRSVNGQMSRLKQLAASLERGLIVQTTSSEAIYLPAGWIHAVFTITGGFLVTMDFTTRDSIEAFSRYLKFNLDTTMDTESQIHCYEYYLGCLNVALTNGRDKIALQSWVSIENQLQAIGDKYPKWRKLAKDIWEKYLSSKETEQYSCSCGWNGLGRSFKRHFENTHLSFVLKTDEVRPRATKRKRSSRQLNRD
jgi:hypothetical protein